MNFISGENRNQMVLMPDSIGDYVDDNNSVRVIEAYIDSLNLAELGFSKPRPNDTGRPMYDPKDLLKLYLYGYMNKVRSSRRLETETKRNLEVIWLLCKLSPDHKTIARFRRDNTAALKNVFRDFVKLCMKLNLYGKELVAIDGSKFKAVNSKDRNFGPKKLEERIARIDAKIEEYLRELEDSDSTENTKDGEKSSEEIAKIITELATRKELYKSYADELNQTGALQKSLTDPDSRLMMANGKMDVCIPADESQAEKILTHTNGRTIYIPERNIAICPMGKVLYPSHYIKRVRKAAYSNYSACKHCTCRCTKGRMMRFETDMPESSFTKDYDDKNLYLRQIHIRPNRNLVKSRKSIVEHSFGTIKRNMDTGFCLMKGLENVSGEFSLTFLAYNLKRAINIMGYKKLIECMT